jgi:hypothetical protein
MGATKPSLKHFKPPQPTLPTSALKPMGKLSRHPPINLCLTLSLQSLCLISLLTLDLPLLHPPALPLTALEMAPYKPFHPSSSPSASSHPKRVGMALHLKEH